MSDERQDGSMVVLGIAGGLATACLVGGLVGYLLLVQARTEGRRGWNLVPVVVAAQDLPAGTTVTFDQISQRSVPEQFVSSSIVKPDSASYIVNQELNAAAMAGDPLLWSSFEQTTTTAQCQALVDSIAARQKAPSPALSQLLGAIKAGAR